MAFHELTTNALKYGALATESGSVEINWTIDATGKEHMLSLVWQESGVSMTSTPTKQGFGRTMIERLVPHGLRGTAKLLFGSSGLCWTTSFPLANVASLGK